MILGADRPLVALVIVKGDTGGPSTDQVVFGVQFLVGAGFTKGQRA